MTHALIVHAHPEPRSFNGALTRQAVETLTAVGDTVEVSDLYAMKFKAVADADDYTERERLALAQGALRARLSGDRRADVLRDLLAAVGELRDIDELDPLRRPWLHARVGRVGALDGLERRLGERGRRLEVVGVGVCRGPLAGRHVRPAQLLPDEFLVLPAGRPRDELPGVVLVPAGVLDRARPRVQPAGALGLH